ncbi:Phox homologous domain [Pseudocohnilembus persalinus]|uniref:Phox homologous domain n=1 Tax=Pseudocohnilembus persalinus TaxID=266149 RepID=A0A0V0R0Q6_PSEPJ|nr:Phox homologous domain [Pseudocohnilembus persalinus]|eukprot:KRX08134.1 Phox homologous domain [Pseudocohnilembus persalinus]
MFNINGMKFLVVNMLDANNKPIKSGIVTKNTKIIYRSLSSLQSILYETLTNTEKDKKIIPQTTFLVEEGTNKIYQDVYRKIEVKPLKQHSVHKIIAKIWQNLKEFIYSINWQKNSPIIIQKIQKEFQNEENQLQKEILESFKNLHKNCINFQLPEKLESSENTDSFFPNQNHKKNQEQSQKQGQNQQGHTSKSQVMHKSISFNDQLQFQHNINKNNNSNNNSYNNNKNSNTNNLTFNQISSPVLSPVKGNYKGNNLQMDSKQREKDKIFLTQKIIPQCELSSSSTTNLVEALNITTIQLGMHQKGRNLNATGQKVIVLTCGEGQYYKAPLFIFEEKNKSNKSKETITKNELLNSQIVYNCIEKEILKQLNLEGYSDFNEKRETKFFSIQLKSYTQPDTLKQVGEKYFRNKDNIVHMKEKNSQEHFQQYNRKHFIYLDEEEVQRQFPYIKLTCGHKEHLVMKDQDVNDESEKEKQYQNFQQTNITVIKKNQGKQESKEPYWLKMYYFGSEHFINHYQVFSKILGDEQLQQHRQKILELEKNQFMDLNIKQIQDIKTYQQDKQYRFRIGLNIQIQEHIKSQALIKNGELKKFDEDQFQLQINFKNVDQSQLQNNLNPIPEAQPGQEDKSEMGSMSLSKVSHLNIQSQITPRNNSYSQNVKLADQLNFFSKPSGIKNQKSSSNDSTEFFTAALSNNQSQTQFPQMSQSSQNVQNIIQNKGTSAVLGGVNIFETDYNRSEYINNQSEEIISNKKALLAQKSHQSFVIFEMEKQWKNLILTPLAPLETPFYPYLSNDNTTKPTKPNVRTYILTVSNLKDFMEEIIGHRLANNFQQINNVESFDAYGNKTALRPYTQEKQVYIFSKGNIHHKFEEIQTNIKFSQSKTINTKYKKRTQQNNDNSHGQDYNQETKDDWQLPIFYKYLVFDEKKRAFQNKNSFVYMPNQFNWQKFDNLMTEIPGQGQSISDIKQFSPKQLQILLIPQYNRELLIPLTNKPENQLQNQSQNLRKKTDSDQKQQTIHSDNSFYHNNQNQIQNQNLSQSLNQNQNNGQSLKMSNSTQLTQFSNQSIPQSQQSRNVSAQDTLELRNQLSDKYSDISGQINKIIPQIVTYDKDIWKIQEGQEHHRSDFFNSLQVFNNQLTNKIFNNNDYFMLETQKKYNPLHSFQMNLYWLSFPSVVISDFLKILSAICKDNNYLLTLISPYNCSLKHEFKEPFVVNSKIFAQSSNSVQLLQNFIDKVYTLDSSHPYQYHFNFIYSGAIEHKQYIHINSHVLISFYVEIYLPVFPGRKMFGSTNKDESDIVQRRNDLNFYFNELLSIQKLHSLEQIKTLILPPQIEKSTFMMAKGQFEDTQATFFTESSLTDNDEDFEMNCPPQGGQIRAKIDRYSVSEDMVSYFITFYDVTQTKSWVFRSRYSELKSLHEALGNQKKVKSLLPSFPKRKLFGITNENPEEIEKRREQLEDYLNQLFQHNEIIENDVIKFYLEDTRRQADQIKHKEEMTIRKKQQGYSHEKIQEICQEFINKDKDLKKYHTQTAQKEETTNSGNNKDNLNILQDKGDQTSEVAKPKKKNKLKYQFLERILEVNPKWESEEFLTKSAQKQYQQQKISSLNQKNSYKDQNLSQNEINIENKILKSESNDSGSNNINSQNSNINSNSSNYRNQTLKQLEAQNEELEREILDMQRKASQFNSQQNLQMQQQQQNQEQDVEKQPSNQKQELVQQ